MINDNKKQFLSKLAESNTAFAAWRLPGQSEISIVASHKIITINEQEIENTQGFIITPFDINKNPSVLIPGDFTWIADKKEGHIELFETSLKTKKTSLSSSVQKTYLLQAETMIAAINNSNVDKVILSRLHVETEAISNTLEVFEKLLRKYPNAYVFWYNTPETGQWMGATPELFAEIIDGTGKTVALAGTRKNRSIILDDEKWHQKEIDEQAIVTNYIEDVLHQNGISDIVKKGPYTINAGHLSHIKTAFHFNLKPESKKWSKLLFGLHPTPAVCGLPKTEAKQLINQTETHDRGYYGGFLGYAENGNINSYVNIRSMKIVGKDAILFVGGGLTHDSVAMAEWDETVLKAQTLLSVLKNI